MTRADFDEKLIIGKEWSRCVNFDAGELLLSILVKGPKDSGIQYVYCHVSINMLEAHKWNPLGELKQLRIKEGQEKLFKKLEELYPDDLDDVKVFTIKECGDELIQARVPDTAVAR